MRVLSCGPSARIVECDDPAGLALGVQRAVAEGRVTGIIDLVPAEATLLIRYAGQPPEAWLDDVTVIPALPGSHGSSIEIPVVYDGEDLDEVARACGLSPEEVIDLHQEPTYRVAFCGFAPGFAYLRGIDPRLARPRRESPRTRVPAGSVAIAAGYSAIYPAPSPGGWHLIGRTDTVMFDPRRDPPALLTPGATVRFHAVASLGDTPAQARSAAQSDARDPVLVVEDSGALALIQDLGRGGHATIGVGPSGAFDRESHRLANRIVGNEESAATIEALGGGLALRAQRHCVVAVTGAIGPLRVDDDPADRNSPVALRPGQVLRLGSAAQGLRSSVAVRGGIDVEPALGSRSHDTLSGLGPPPLAPGDRLAVLEPAHPVVVDHVPAGSHGAPLTLRLHPGPRRDWFTGDAAAALRDATFIISGDSDRVGVRLLGPALERLDSGRELPSEGVIRGAMQVPPDGQPVILGPDHPVTGGYPVIGIVDDADTDLLAQALPGTPVRFALVGW